MPTFKNPKKNINTQNTKKNGAFLIVNTIKTAPFFCVCPVFVELGSAVGTGHILGVSRISLSVL
jgi:hypothetical protein